MNCWLLSHQLARGADDERRKTAPIKVSIAQALMHFLNGSIRNSQSRIRGGPNRGYWLDGFAPEMPARDMSQITGDEFIFSL
jgi:hypothetical protein